METSFERSKNVYKSKIPEIEQTLELIKLMIKKEEDEEEMITNYNLCDTIYAAAKVRCLRRIIFQTTVSYPPLLHLVG